MATEDSGIRVKDGGNGERASVGSNSDLKIKEERGAVIPKDISAEKPFRWKVLKTIFLACVWICMGLLAECTGPALLDLKLRTHSDYESLSTGLAGSSVGAFIGAVCGGVLVDKFGGFINLIVALSLTMEAMASCAIPWMPNPNFIFALTFVLGMMEGQINVSGQKMIINMWTDKATGPLHLLHGGYGIGSFIIPLIANPFLAQTTEVTVNKSTYENLQNLANIDETLDFLNSTKLVEVVTRESKVEYAYGIAAIIAVSFSLVFYTYHITGRKDRRRQTNKVKEDIDTNTALSFREMFNPATCAGGNALYGIQIIGIVFLYYVQAQGGEQVGGKLIRTYAIKHLEFSEDDGSYINTAFWAAFSVGRMIGLLTGRFIPIRILIMLESGGCLIFAILLLIFGGDSTIAFWVLMPLLGFFIAPLYPSGVGWANYHIEMTGICITIFILGGSVGGFIYMKLTGYLFDHYGYYTYLYVLLGFSIAIVSICSLMNIIGYRHDKKSQQTESDIALEVKTNKDGTDLEYSNQVFTNGDHLW